MPYHAVAALIARHVTRRHVAGALATDDPAPQPLIAVPTAVASPPDRRRRTVRALDRRTPGLGTP